MLEGQAGTQKKHGKRTLKLLLDAFKNRDGCFKPFLCVLCLSDFLGVENPFLNMSKTASKRPLCLKSQPRGGRCKAADALMHCGAAELL